MKMNKMMLFKAFNLSINTKELETVESILQEVKENKKVRANHNMVAHFNRALCKLGVAYFKQGNCQKCKDLLKGICNSGNMNIDLYQYNA